MKKCILSMMLILAVLTAHVAHAAGVDSDNGIAKTNKEYKSDGAKPKSKDDCCAHGFSYSPDQIAKDFVVSSMQPGKIADDDKTPSVAAGPPLKPPSRV